MRKSLKIFCSLIFLISASLILFACQQQEVVLQKPQHIGWTNAAGIALNENNEPILDENGNKTFGEDKFVLVTSECKGATTYMFYLTNNEDYENMDNYVAYPSETNYLDVTDKIDPKKSWHFCVQYIGGGKFKNSPISDIKEISPENMEQVASPYVQLSGDKIVWTNIQNATGYEIYEEILDKNDNVMVKENKIGSVVATSGTTTYEYNVLSRASGDQSPYRKYVYSIKAVASGYYLSSAESNKVTFIKSITLAKTANVKANFETKVLTWDSVKYATKYEISVLNSTTETKYESVKNSLDLSEILSAYTTYKFSVKAVGSDAISFVAGEKSEEISKDYTTKLDTPQNLVVTSTGDKIYVSCDPVVNGGNYTLQILWGNYKFEISNLTKNETNINREISFDELKQVGTLFGSSDSELLTIKIKANQINQYYFDSEFEETILTITKQTVVSWNKN